MRKIAIYVEDGLMLSTFGVVYDALVLAGVGWNDIVGHDRTPYFEVFSVSETGDDVSCYGGLTLSVDKPIVEVTSADTIIIMPSDASTGMPSSRLSDWLCRANAAGKHIAAICVGAFRLAATGMLANKTATTHWAYVTRLQQDFPSVDVRGDRLITDEGNLFCAGGMNAAADLALYLIAKYAGNDCATEVARANLLDMDRTSQAVYDQAVYPKNHGDHQILEIQNWMELNSDQHMSIPELADRVGLSVRTLERRFAAATGSSPYGYLRTIRMQKAKSLLSRSAKPLKVIAAEVGYEDDSSFSQAFKKYIGLPPGQYRKKYRVHA